MVEREYNQCACGTTLRKNSKQCRKCAGKSGPTAGQPLPKDNQIIKEVNSSSARRVANKYGVSETTIKKILLKYPNYKNMK